MMQIVIDVPEKLVCEGFERPFTEEEKNIFIKAIGNGTPLPKGHGRLIDADSLWNAYHDLDYDFYEAFDLAETIIEADTESEE